MADESVLIIKTYYAKIMNNIREAANYKLPVERVTEYIYLGDKVTLGFENQTAKWNDGSRRRGLHSVPTNKC